MTVADPATQTPPDAGVQARGSVQVALEAARVARELGPRYAVARLLGRGGFASVWEVVDGVVAERLAAKRFESDAVRGSGFYREMFALFRLDHPNIVRIVNLLDVSEITRYLFLEYCTGGTFRDLLRRTRRDGQSLPIETVAQMALELAKGLRYAHRLGLVHRDLKPENILFTGRTGAGSPGITKLADFGLVRALRSGEVAGLSRLSGTPAYIAPEQISGQFSTGSDLYALGVVLYEALHGRTPFDGSPEEIALQHLNRPPAISPDLPADWIEILSALLEKDPARRPTDATWLIDRLGASEPPSIETRSIAPTTARCLGIGATAIAAEGTSGVIVLTPFGLFRFRHSTATRAGIIHQAASLARTDGFGSLWLGSGPNLLQLSIGEADARTVVRTAEPIDDIAHSHANDSHVVIRTGSILLDHDTSETPPKLRWRREIDRISRNSLARLTDGRLAVGVESETSRIELLDETGTTTGAIDLPGACGQLLPLDEVLFATIKVGGVAVAARIDPASSTVEILDGHGELVALATDPSDFHSLIGLFNTGEIVRWNSTGNPMTLGRFPEEEGPFLGLAVSGDLLWALSARNDSTWLIVQPINPPQ